MALALAAMATPAAAGWQDYMGKTIIVMVRSAGHTTVDAIEVRGTEYEDRVTEFDCLITYHIYISSKGRAFQSQHESECQGEEPSTSNQKSGDIFDLTKERGIVESNGDYAVHPYVLTVEPDAIVLDRPAHDHVYRDPGGVFVSTTSNSAGNDRLRIDFDPFCEFYQEGDWSFRTEYVEPGGAYILDDTQINYRSVTIGGCKLVEGFVP